MISKYKASHIINWFYGNICTRKCYYNTEKQRECHDKMVNMILGKESLLVSHKIFIKAVRQKYKICDLSENDFNKSERNFWTKKL
ncbi:MAG: hypothetical protein ACD_46C00105G0003 [uncultured bacterium]|nr:MAG: hypothetical protein ACD_46C00105G0003 [uncultured bacterium]